MNHEENIVSYAIFCGVFAAVLIFLVLVIQQGCAVSASGKSRSPAERVITEIENEEMLNQWLKIQLEKERQQTESK